MKKQPEKTEKIDFLDKKAVTARLITESSPISQQKFIGKPTDDPLDIDAPLIEIKNIVVDTVIEEGRELIKKENQLTKDDLKDLVITPEGHIYPLSEITQYLEFSKKDPMTQSPLELKQCRPLDEENVDFELLNTLAQELLVEEKAEYLSKEQLTDLLMKGRDFFSGNQRDFIGFDKKKSIITVQEGKKLTKDDLKDLIITPQGNIYLSSGIEEHLKNSKTDPLTKKNLSTDQLKKLDENNVDFEKLNKFVDVRLKERKIEDMIKMIDLWGKEAEILPIDFRKPLNEYIALSKNTLRRLDLSKSPSNDIGPIFHDLRNEYEKQFVNQEKKSQEEFKNREKELGGVMMKINSWQKEVEQLSENYQAPLLQYIDFS
jgi:hypothetical protein